MRTRSRSRWLPRPERRTPAPYLLLGIAALGLSAPAQSQTGTIDASSLPPIQPRRAPAASASSMALLLATKINGRDVGFQAAQIQQGSLRMARSSLLALGVKESTLGASSSGDPWLVLASLPGMEVDYNAATQSLVLQLPISQLSWASTVVQTRDGMPVASHASPGVALNYDLYAVQSGGARNISAMTELRAFNASGVLSNTMLSQYASGTDTSNSSGSHTRQLRMDTSYSMSWPEEMLTLRIGDTLSSSLPWSRATRMGGIQLARNFALQPYRTTSPIPALMGSSALPSDIALYINGVQQYQGKIPSGPFTINTAPGITGTGAAQVVLTDIMGRQTTLQYSFYGANTLLAKGLSDWSAELGWVRKDYGQRSFAYGSDPVASGSWSYGLSDTLTVQSHGEATSQLVNLGGGASWQIGVLGVVSAAAAASQHDGSNGHLLQLGHQWSSDRFNFNVQATRASTGYRDAASLYDSTRQRSAGRAIVGFNHPLVGSLSTGLVYLHNFDQPAQRYATFGWSKPIGRQAYVSFNVNHNLDDRRQSTAQVLLNWVMGDNINTGVMASHQNGNNTLNAYASQSRPSSGGWGWSANAQQGDSTNAQARLDYLGRSFEANASVTSSGGNTSASAGLSGALVGMGGHLYPSRRLYDGFALVSTNGVPHVPIKRENNLIGSTDDNGMLLVTQLGAYRNNKISIDPMRLPGQLRVPAPDQLIVPTDRAGTLVKFDIERIQSASLILVDQQGQALPLGSVARIVQAPAVASNAPARSAGSLVGFDGVTYFENLPASSVIEVRTPEGQLCRANATYPETTPGEVPTIGPLPCAPQ